MAKPKPIQQVGSQRVPTVKVEARKAAPKPPSPTGYDPSRQVAGYERRLEASGISSDTRNWFEKLTNLTPNQNWFFDGLELWDRSTRAVAGFASQALSEMDRFEKMTSSGDLGVKILAGSLQRQQEGRGALGATAMSAADIFGSEIWESVKNVGSATVGGLTGDNRVSFDEVVQQLGGFENSNFVTKLLGFGLEIFADPNDAIKFAKGFMSTADVMSDANNFRKFLDTGGNGVKLLSEVSDIAKTTDDLIDIVKMGRKAMRLAAAGDTSAEVLAMASKYQRLFKAVSKEGFTSPAAYKSINQIIFGTAGKAIGKTTKVADNLAIKGMNYVDEAGNVADFYAAAKTGIKKMFTRLGSVSQSTMDKVRKQFGLEALSKKQMKLKWDKEMMPILENIAKNYNLDIDDVYKMSLEYIEYFYDPKSSVKTIIRKSISQPLDQASAEVVKAVFSSPVFNDDVILKNIPDIDNQFIKIWNDTKRSYADTLTKQANEALTPAAVPTLTGAGEDILDIATSPRRKAKAVQEVKPLSIADEIEQIVKSPRKQQKAQQVARWNQQQQQEMLAFATRLNKAKDIDEYEQILKEIIQKGYLPENALDNLYDFLRQDEAYKASVKNRLFNAIYEPTEVDGMKGYALKNRKLLDDTLELLEREYKYLVDSGYLEALDFLIENQRFAQGSDIEQAFRKMLGTGKRSGMNLFSKIDESSSIFGRKFEDIFKLTDEGWVLKNSNDLLEINDILTFYDKFDEIITNPRWITEAEKAEAEWILKQPFIDDLKKFSEEYANLSRINDEIFGIDLSSKLPEGYVRHHLREDIPVKSRKAIPEGIRKADDTAEFVGNVKFIDTREYQMTVKEANRIARWEARRMLQNPKLSEEHIAFWSSRANQDLFSDSIVDSVLDMVKYQPELAGAARRFERMLIESALLDEDVFRVLQPGEGTFLTGKAYKVGDVTADGYRVIEVGTVRKKLQSFKSILDDPVAFDDFVKRFLKDANGNDLPNGALAMMDVNVFDIIGRDWRKVGNEFWDGVVKIIDPLNNTFKRFKVLSVGMHLRNIVGNFTNMIIAGMEVPQILRKTVEANNVLKFGPDVLEQAMLKGLNSLSSDQMKIYTYYVEFIKNNFDDAAVGVQGIDELLDIIRKGKDKTDLPKWKRVLNQVTELNSKANVAVDSRYRMAMLIHATENPEFYLNKGLNSAGDAVRQALFDPNDLTGFERNVMRRLIPFYTFSKKNMVHQGRSLFENPGVYRKVIKASDASWQLAGLDIEDIEQYKREQLWVPIPGLTSGNQYVALKLNLPMEELAEGATNPALKIFASTSPIARAPWELLTNTQIFTGRPIQDYKGQTSYTFNDVPILENLPRWVDYGLSQLGIDVPLAPVTTIVAGINRLVKNETNNLPVEIFTGALRSAVSVGDIEKARRAKSYDRLDELQDIIRYYRDKGTPIKTIPEIENENKGLQDLDIRIKQFVRGKEEVFTPPRRR